MRMNFDLQNSEADGSQRMLNAIEPDSPLPIHQHRSTSETVVCLRGRLIEDLCSEDGGEMVGVRWLGGGVGHAGWGVVHGAVESGTWDVMEEKYRRKNQNI